jgi:methenyltetrahydromethanopterin cyclohydrolase
MNLNENAVRIVEEIISKRKKLKIGVVELENGAKIVDCGIKYDGGFEAGRLYSLACLGGIAQVKLEAEKFGDLTLKKVEVETEYPVIACLASQKAGWNIRGQGFYAMGSGPARILAQKPRETYEKIGYSEESDRAVLALECSRYPPADICDNIAEACGVSPDGLYLLVAKTASIVGTTQISARALETCLYKIEHLGQDLNNIVRGKGSALIPPIVGDDAKMMGITNDMIIYGSKVYLESLGDMELENIPSSSSPAYGKLFEEIFREAGYDFYKINPDIFAPAEVVIKNINTGEERKAGKMNLGMVRKSIGI